MGIRFSAVALVVPIAFGVWGCGEEAASTSGDLPDGRTFLSMSVAESGEPRPLVEGTRIRMDFGEGGLSVQAGCNYLDLGKVRQVDERLVVGRHFFTEMGCSKERMEQDNWVLEFMTSEPTVRLDGDTLWMTSGEATIELLDLEVATPDQPLVGPRWRINTIIDGQSETSYNADAEAYLVFDADGTLRGRTACNAFSASYEVDGTTLSGSGLTTTKAACDDYGALIEAALYDVLRDDSTIDIETRQLTLTSADGNGVSLRTNL